MNDPTLLCPPRGLFLSYGPCSHVRRGGFPLAYFLLPEGQQITGRGAAQLLAAVKSVFIDDSEQCREWRGVTLLPRSVLLPSLVRS